MRLRMRVWRWGSLGVGLRAITVIVVFVALAVCTLVGGSAARAEGQATPTLDRTYVCAVFFRGGAYLLDAHAHSGTKRGSSWARLPYAGVRTGHNADVFGGAGNLLAWITSGRPTKGTMVDQGYGAFDVATVGTVGVRRESCRGTSGSVALSPSGLRGGSAAPLGNEFECFAPKQVVVRVRAVLAAPGALRAGQDFQSAHVPVREAKLAVRTVTGKPLVYADVSESGRARIFATKGCSQQ